jgi:hypothetical protein
MLAKMFLGLRVFLPTRQEQDPVLYIGFKQHILHPETEGFNSYQILTWKPKDKQIRL